MAWYKMPVAAAYPYIPNAHLPTPHDKNLQAILQAVKHRENVIWNGRTVTGGEWFSATYQPGARERRFFNRTRTLVPAARLIAACRALAPLRGGMVKPLRVLVCGIPNVGKSTLINTLVRRKAAKTGDEAGITRTEQVIALASDVTLFDTPGMLWPRITVPQSGLHLAASGAIGRNAYDEQEVALALLERLQASDPAALAGRYKLPDPVALAALQADALLGLIARQRGLIQSKGRLDLQKAVEAVLNDFRCGALGRITLQTPAEHAAWVAAGEAQDAARRARKARPAG